MFNESLVSSNTNEWGTPQKLFEILNEEFHFTLDPCSNNENYKTGKHYTIQENGLLQDWSGERVYMNPPYGYETSKWIEKAFQESQKGAIVVCLIVARTDTSYWHDIIFKYATQIRFIRGKIKFDGAKWNAPFASAIVIFDSKKYKEKIVYYNISINKIIKQT